MIKQLFEQGIAIQLAEAAEKEVIKQGTLRAGNTGMINDRGQIIGSCAATTYLRMLGINLGETDLNKELMFSGGRMNEEHWLSVLRKSYSGPILCEEEIATSWTTTSGIEVTGRPDIVLCKDTPSGPAPNCVIELKQIMSVNSAYNVLIKQEPQLKHLMQAAHYMFALECENCELWYTNRNNLDMPAWMLYRQFPPPSKNLNSINYRYYKHGEINPKTGRPKKIQITEDEYYNLFSKLGNSKVSWAEKNGEWEPVTKYAPALIYEPSKITPFMYGFKLRLDDRGNLLYQNAMTDTEEWVETIVSIEQIKRFYNFVGELEEYGKVPKAALNLSPTGEKMGWGFWQYSDLGDLDPYYWAGKGLSEWVEKVRAKFS